ncbi:MAG: DUF5675 family protein [Deltaproteobacteria bacterium]|jgi:hypothetical protein|nr:DUF5675 family protein [Deltaproteobacteria bacterium]
MRQLNLIRKQQSDQGTFGLLVGEGWSLFTVELPWRENKREISCIPCGQYICRLVYSPRFKKNLYLLGDVPGRSGVLIHAGNWAGDVALDFKSNSQGCILPGTAKGAAAGQLAVLNSAAAMRKLMAYMSGESFTLEISGGAL